MARWFAKCRFNLSAMRSRKAKGTALRILAVAVSALIAVLAFSGCSQGGSASGDVSDSAASPNGGEPSRWLQVAR